MIGILDIGMGNLGSVWNATYESGFDPEIVIDPDDLDQIDHLILPGVGHFATAMEKLCEMGMVSPLRSYVESGRPLLGLCVGMQVLATEGTEGARTPGLDIIAGTVDRLPVNPPFRVPHIGWNAVSAVRDHPVLERIKPERDFYFVHSYAFRPVDEANIVARTEYGAPFASIVGRANVLGCQFHPEKSQANGLRILENFCRWDGVC